ncbi:uncharacterized protein LOC116306381 [Actinia tenebrosa]|uniref:Uncharacterized protein LOC116306381 n=1 Tax=Actinia tenebrosa TaxID=6105 RepID=A0A6P8J2J5_ACTTE|nr:uncharacterized protein LOC116306381 [Actinia tenebrosa]
MPCCKTTNAWVYNLRVGQENRLYTVQLLREIGCCNENYHIFVNGEEHSAHELKYNFCSPLYGRGGKYEWEQDGHHFLLMGNFLSFTKSLGGYRLFIDGIDVNTGREFYTFWLRKGFQVIAIGLVFLLLGAALTIVVLLTTYGNSFVEIVGYILALSGLTYIIIGIIPVIRFRNPSSAYHHTEFEYSPARI